MSEYDGKVWVERITREKLVKGFYESVDTNKWTIKSCYGSHEVYSSQKKAEADMPAYQELVDHLREREQALRDTKELEILRKAPEERTEKELKFLRECVAWKEIQYWRDVIAKARA